MCQYNFSLIFILIDSLSGKDLVSISIFFYFSGGGIFVKSLKEIFSKEVKIEMPKHGLHFLSCDFSTAFIISDIVKKKRSLFLCPMSFCSNIYGHFPECLLQARAAPSKKLCIC